MAIEASIIAAIAAKYGLSIVRKKGWLPKNYYLGQAIRELQQDNLESAIQNWKLAFDKDRDNLENLAVREIIESEIDLRSQLLGKRIAFLEDKKRELNKKRLRLKIRLAVPFMVNKNKYLEMKRQLDTAVLDLDREIHQFREGIRILENVVNQLYSCGETGTSSL